MPSALRQARAASVDATASHAQASRAQSSATASRQQQVATATSMSASRQQASSQQSVSIKNKSLRLLEIIWQNVQDPILCRENVF